MYVRPPHKSSVCNREGDTVSCVGFFYYSVLLKFLIKKIFPCQKFKEGKKNNLVSHSQFFIILFLFFEFSQELFFPPSVWKMLFVLIFTSGLLLVVTFCSLRWPHVLWRRVRPEAKIIFRSHSHTICESLSIFLVSFWRKEKKEMLFLLQQITVSCAFLYDIYWENSSMVAALRIEKGGGNQIQENLISLLQFDQFLLHRVNFF